MAANALPQTVRLSRDGASVVIIDQTKLPGDMVLRVLSSPEDVYEAIRVLRVRGAPAIGVAAAYGAYLAALGSNEREHAAFVADFQRAVELLDSSRPTAVNLSWALRRMERVVQLNPDASIEELRVLLRCEADRIHDEDVRVCRAIGEYGVKLLRPRWGILTHCNAGRLAAVEYGTATAPIYVGDEQGYNFHVFCNETRPLLQGMRLTAFELTQAGINTTVICDNMAPTVLRKRWVQAVLVGCDRVAANGDTANKVGTSGVALAARYYGVPFYVCAPTSTIDMSCRSGEDIPIEERDRTEVTDMWFKAPMGPAGVNIFNPSFDVTDAGNITAIITEYGVAYPPYEPSLRSIMQLKESGEEHA